MTTAGMLLHKLNQGLQRANNEPVAPDWDDLAGSPSEWMLESNRLSVERIVAGLFDPEKEHEEWYQERWNQGWRWGEVRDNERKLNPAMVPYRDLSPVDKAKDIIRVELINELIRLGLLQV